MSRKSKTSQNQIEIIVQELEKNDKFSTNNFLCKSESDEF